ncbi:hypothetical protein [Lysinibacillus fusiformis]|uniref:hypothetical protein n=1 Tax=Lysinibacillus fusiformis TaxID=28031 RepID=UPI0011A33CC4|nr:hypothetical protein [Lysinibacillus fusiformis]
MSVYRVEGVFGVKKDAVLSYIQRKQVDEKFKGELLGDRHIIVYGSSKQGKSSLIQKHISNDNCITIGCSTNMTTKDIYSSLLRQLNIQIKTSSEQTLSTSGETFLKTTFKAILPFFGESSVEASGKLVGTESNKSQSDFIEYKLEIAQDISELLKRIKFNKSIIIENFHYLTEEVQKIFSIDLRLFQENGIRFVVLGIWREKNRLTQFNRDLLDRTVEIPVEPWEEEDFDRVVTAGSELLRIKIDDLILKEIKEIAFGNIGIVQELCKELILQAGITETADEDIEINNQEYLERAIEVKIEEYASSHLRSLESIADTGHQSNGLYLPYYLVKYIVESDINDLKDGVSKTSLHESIKKIHHKSDNVRTSDMTNLLHSLAEKQSKKKISPPLFDYDRVNRRLRIIDSTLMFFLNFKNKEEIMDEILCPFEV